MQKRWPTVLQQRWRRQRLRTCAPRACASSRACSRRRRLAPLRAAIDALEPRKLQNRRAHRWEHVHDPDAAVFQELAARPEIAAIVRALLGSKTYLEKAGLILSHPGAEAQRWPPDNPHLYAIPTHLPPHSSPSSSRCAS